MTSRELAKLLTYCEEYTRMTFRDAANDDNDISRAIKAKNNKSTKTKVVDYTLEETLYAMRRQKTYTPAELIYTEENFIHRDTPYFDKRTVQKNPLSRDARNFLFIHRNATRFYAVCSTCKFIAARKMNMPGSRYHPYCTLFSAFLNKALPKRNIYKDRCDSYRCSAGEPLVLTRDGKVYSERNTDDKKTLGIDNSEFTTGRTKSGPIPVLRKTRTVASK